MQHVIFILSANLRTIDTAQIRDLINWLPKVRWSCNIIAEVTCSRRVAIRLPALRVKKGCNTPEITYPCSHAIG